MIDRIFVIVLIVAHLILWPLNSPQQQAKEQRLEQRPCQENTDA